VWSGAELTAEILRCRDRDDADRFWIMTLRIVGLYSYAIDRIDLDFHGHVTSGPTEQTTFQAYLFSPPRVIATAGRQIWAYQGDFNSAAPLTVAQACP
jgi:hypothetical protein